MTRKNCRHTAEVGMVNLKGSPFHSLMIHLRVAAEDSAALTLKLSPGHDQAVVDIDGHGNIEGRPFTAKLASAEYHALDDISNS